MKKVIKKSMIALAVILVLYGIYFFTSSQVARINDLSEVVDSVVEEQVEYTPLPDSIPMRTVLESE
jgi:hypothetical protein